LLSPFFSYLFFYNIIARTEIRKEEDDFSIKRDKTALINFYLRAHIFFKNLLIDYFLPFVELLFSYVFIVTIFNLN
jgi:hypothetical protein